MGLPGHRRTSSDKRRRASHFALKKITLGICPKCKKPVRPHTTCGFCGYYAGRKVINKAEPGAKRKKGETAAK